MTKTLRKWKTPERIGRENERDFKKTFEMNTNFGKRKMLKKIHLNSYEEYSLAIKLNNNNKNNNQMIASNFVQKSHKSVCVEMKEIT